MFKGFKDVKDGEKYSDYIRRLNFDETLEFYRNFKNSVLETPYLRQSEYFGGKGFEGDIVYISQEDVVGTVTQSILNLNVTGNSKNFFDDDFNHLDFIQSKVKNLTRLEGESVRYIYTPQTYEEGDIATGITLKCENNLVYGEIHLWQCKKKPFRISKVIEFKYSGDEVEINVVDNSLMVFSKTAYTIYHHHRELAMSDITGAMYDHFNTEHEIYHKFNDSEFIGLMVSMSLNLFLHNHLSVVAGIGDYGEEDGKLVLGDSFQLYPDVKKQMEVESYSGDYLEVDSNWYKPNMEYLKLVSKIAQLGSELVVPRDEIVSYSEFKEKYFHDVGEEGFKAKEGITEVAGLNIPFIGDKYLGLKEDRMENLYFSYVWNRLYFKIPKIWTQIQLLHSKRKGFIIRYDDIYNSLSIEHVDDRVPNKLAYFFKGDIDLEDLTVKVYPSNCVLNSLRAEFRSYNICRVIELIYDLVRDKMINLVRDREGYELTFSDVENMLCSDTLTESIYSMLCSRGYSLEELTNMFCIDDSKKLKNTIIAGELEDYSSSLINYILISVLIAEKSKIAQVLEELYEEVDSETPEELKKKLNNKIKPNMIDTKKIGDKVTYVFTGAKVNDLNKMLGHHLKRRKATFKYTTPYWVRRGHFRTSRSGERVWVSEQVCKRDPELLSVKVDEDDSTGRIYRATNLF